MNKAAREYYLKPRRSSSSQGSPFLTVGITPFFILGKRKNLGDLLGTAIFIETHHGEIAGICMSFLSRTQILGHDLDADLHRGSSRIIHRREKSHYLADLDGLAEIDAVHGHRHAVRTCVPGRAYVGHAVGDRKNSPSIHGAGKIGMLRHHELAHFGGTIL